MLIMIDKNLCAECWQDMDIMDRLREICPISMENVDEMEDCPMDTWTTGICK